MKKFEEAEIEVLEFAVEDVITESNGDGYVQTTSCTDGDDL